MAAVVPSDRVAVKDRVAELDCCKSVVEACKPVAEDTLDQVVDTAVPEEESVEMDR